MQAQSSSRTHQALLQRERRTTRRAGARKEGSSAAQRALQPTAGASGRRAAAGCRVAPANLFRQQLLYQPLPRRVQSSARASKARRQSLGLLQIYVAAPRAAPIASAKRLLAMSLTILPVAPLVYRSGPCASTRDTKLRLTNETDRLRETRRLATHEMTPRMRGESMIQHSPPHVASH